MADDIVIRGQQPAAGRPCPPKPSCSLPTKPPSSTNLSSPAVADDEKCVQVGSFVWKWHESVGWYDADDDDPAWDTEIALLDEIKRLRALIIQWDAAFFGRPRVGDLPPEISLVDAEFALHEEARRG